MVGLCCDLLQISTSCIYPPAPRLRYFPSVFSLLFHLAPTPTFSPEHSVDTHLPYLSSHYTCCGSFFLILPCPPTPCCLLSYDSVTFAWCVAHGLCLVWPLTTSEILLFGCYLASQYSQLGGGKPPIKYVSLFSISQLSVWTRTLSVTHLYFKLWLFILDMVTGEVVCEWAAPKGAACKQIVLALTESSAGLLSLWLWRLGSDLLLALLFIEPVTAQDCLCPGLGAWLPEGLSSLLLPYSLLTCPPQLREGL